MTISAAEIEGLVTAQIHKLLAKPEIIAQVITASVIAKYDNEDDRLQDVQIIEALKDVSKVWEELFPAEQVRITHLLIKKVILNPDGVDIRIFNEGFNQFTEELTNSRSEQHNGKFTYTT